MSNIAEMLNTANVTTRNKRLPVGVHEVSVTDVNLKEVNTKNGRKEILEISFGNTMGNQIRSIWIPDLENTTPYEGESQEAAIFRALKKYNTEASEVLKTLFEGTASNISGSTVKAFTDRFVEKLNVAKTKNTKVFVVNANDENSNYSKFPKYDWIMPMNDLPNNGFVLSKYDLGSTSSHVSDTSNENPVPQGAGEDLPF